VRYTVTVGHQTDDRTEDRRPSVSVVIPVRDGSRIIGRALETARAALDENGEIVVVDNDSHDDTFSIAAVHADVVLRVSGVVSACRFAGVEASSHELIFFADADQVLLPDTITSAVNCLQRTGASAVIVPERPLQPTHTWLMRLLSAERALTEAVGAGAPRLITKDAYRRVFPLSPDLVFAEDWAFTRLLCAGPISEVPILHEEPATIVELLRKYARYGRHAAAARSNGIRTFGIGARAFSFARALGSLDGSQRAWLVPVCGLKVLKAIALFVGYAIGRLQSFGNQRSLTG
jgi:hypothetical protein